MKHLQILKTPENVHPFTEAGFERRTYNFKDLNMQDVNTSSASGFNEQRTAARSIHPASTRLSWPSSIHQTCAEYRS